MAVIKNINPVQRILEEANVIPRLSSNADKKKVLLDSLEARGVNLNTVADAITNQLFSDDENVKDKAIERMLKLTDIVQKEGQQVPVVNIMISGYESSLNSILIPRSES